MQLKVEAASAPVPMTCTRYGGAGSGWGPTSAIGPNAITDELKVCRHQHHCSR